MNGRRIMAASGAVTALLLAAGCASAQAGQPAAGLPTAAAHPQSTSTPSVSPSAQPSTSPAPGRPPKFTATVSGPLRPKDVPYSWRHGCPVPPRDLRAIRMRYIGFDHRAHKGTLIVNAKVTRQVVKVFARLYRARFPIFKMVPVDVFHGSDPKSMAADNTSGFNCRKAVAPGPPQWSMHAYGLAIDVNTVQNPYVEAGVGVQPKAGRKYLDRSRHRRGMAFPGGVLVTAFSSIGWGWGGEWSPSPDYQHFSSNGR